MQRGLLQLLIEASHSHGLEFPRLETSLAKWPNREKSQNQFNFIESLAYAQSQKPRSFKLILVDLLNIRLDISFIYVYMYI